MKQIVLFTKQQKISKKLRITTARPPKTKSSIDRNYTRRRKFWRREIEKFGWQNSDTIAAVHWISVKRVSYFSRGLVTSETSLVTVKFLERKCLHRHGMFS